MDLIHPHTPAEVAESLRAASADRSRMLRRGRPAAQRRRRAREVDAELWTTGLDGVVAYDPAEMLCVVEAGVPDRTTFARRLPTAGRNGRSTNRGDATVGGVIAADVALPRQLRVGLLRDSVVEMAFVTGDGRVIRSGARTVKNVTGYDVHRLLTGARGTLGVITQVALKVRPLPKVARTLVTNEGGLELGLQLLEAVPFPAAVLAEHDRVLVRLEGWPDEVAEQARAVTAVAVMADDDPSTWLDPAFPEASIVARAAVPPSRSAPLLEGVDALPSAARRRVRLGALRRRGSTRDAPQAGARARRQRARRAGRGRARPRPTSRWPKSSAGSRPRWIPPACWSARAFSARHAGVGRPPPASRSASGTRIAPSAPRAPAARRTTTRARRDPAFSTKIARRGHVVVEAERRDVGHHVVRALRNVGRKPGGGELAHHHVAPLRVLRAHPLVVARRQRHRRDPRHLQRCRGRHRQEVVGRSGCRPSAPAARSPSRPASPSRRRSSTAR